MRKLLSLLVVVAILASFAIPAYAADNYLPKNETNGDIDTNYSYIGTNNGSIENNTPFGVVGGSITTNNGTVTNNNGNVTTNNGTVTTNEGTVSTNGVNGTVETNNDRVTTNNGTVETNEGTVVTNNGTVESNTENGTVNVNNGTIEINNGTVGSSTPILGLTTNGNNGTIEINNGTVAINKEGAEIGINTGVVESNHGTIEVNFGEVNNETANIIFGGNGTVETNFGKVTEKDGTVRLAIVYHDEMDEEGAALIVCAEDAINGQYTIMSAEAAAAAGFVKTGYELVGFTDFDGVEFNFGATGTTDAVMYLIAMYNPITHEVVYVPAYTAQKMVGGVETLKANRVLYRSAEQAANAITVKVDGTEVEADNYTVELDDSYNVIITLSDAFLGTLSAGDHVMTIYMASGYVFTVPFTK